MEARLAHPVYQPVRRWLERLPTLCATLDELNGFAAEAAVRVESGKPLRFVAPASRQGRYGDYEMQVFESGCVETRPGNRHDLFNALAWLAFPQTKARLNALHAATIPREGGRRGRFRDLLTLLDEGGAIVECADAGLEEMLRGFRWKELFWESRDRVLRDMRIRVLGHAVLEQALEPWPGITCKAILVAPSGDADAHAAAWLARLPPQATPRDVPPLPIYGYPAWHSASAAGGFYDDARYFRPAPRRSTAAQGNT